MQWQFSPYSLALAITGTLNLALALNVWRRRPAPGATGMFYLMLAACIWAWGNAVEIGYFDVYRKAFWVRVALFGTLTVPALWLVLALQYTGRDKWLTGRNLILLLSMPVILLTIAWTNGVNDGHGLYWKYLEVDTSGAFSAWGDVIRGPFFWIAVIYGYSLILIGSLTLIYAAVRSSHLYRGQIGAMLIGSSVPLVGHIIYISDMNPIPGLDITSFLFTISGVAFSWSLFRFRLFDVIPVAQSVVVESLSYG